jgi:hypothetical protein
MRNDELKSGCQHRFSIHRFSIRKRLSAPSSAVRRVTSKWFWIGREPFRQARVGTIISGLPHFQLAELFERIS